MRRIAICFFVAVFILLSLSGCLQRTDNKTYALKIDGEKISLNEYIIYLYEQKRTFEEKGGYDIWEIDFDGTNAKDVAKQNAINSIVLVKTAIKEAANMNIKLDSDDMDIIEQETETFFNQINKDISDIKITKADVNNVMLESRIQQKVYELVTNGFEISKIDFEVYFNEYYETNKKQLNEVEISFIFIDKNSEDAEQKMEEIYSKILFGEDFQNLKQLYSQSQDKENIFIKVGMFNPQIEDAAYNLEQGEVSDIIQTNEGFYILKAVNVVKPDMDKLKEEVKQYYIQQKKQEIYQKQSDSWASDIVIEKNENLWKKDFFEMFNNKE